MIMQIKHSACVNADQVFGRNINYYGDVNVDLVENPHKKEKYVEKYRKHM